MRSVARPHVTHEDIADRIDHVEGRLDKGEVRFLAVEKKLDEVLELLKVLPAMQADIAETKEIVEAYSTVKNMGRFLKWAAGILGAITVIIIAVKTGWAHVIR